MESIIISLGGSLIYPKNLGKINTSYIATFRDCLKLHIAQKKRFFIVTGGGDIARQYQQSAQELSPLMNTDLDLLGIEATRLNALFLQKVTSPESYPRIITDPTQDYPEIEECSLIIASGWHPGNSTDYIAVKLAEKHQAKRIINLTNIDYVYTDDPRINPEATPIPELSWAQYRSMISSEWTPGASAPFDPVASKEAEEKELTVHIMNGENLDNFSLCLKNQQCNGTVIK